MSKTHHCLYHILPPTRHLDSLRERGHPFSLPDFSTSIHKKSFVVRTLYKFIYTIIIHSSLYHYICLFVYVFYYVFLHYRSL